MRRSSRLFLFPDVNVWVALTSDAHIHHPSARAWFDALDIEARVGFCRFTQISLLRLLTTEAVMGRDDVMTQRAAWEAYDRWLSDDRVLFLNEPPNVETVFRSLSRGSRSDSKGWADSYLAAFAVGGEMQLVTFDRAFKGRVEHLLVLES